MKPSILLFLSLIIFISCVEEEDFPLEKEQIIEFKRMGILPLRINSEGIDEDTGLPRESFGGGLNNLGNYSHLKPALVLGIG